ncbi:MAG TPA: glutaredoxin family protein [Actinomycetales bacterium]|nr:glutaredoxin family protein [Actinomycetales bacterium]
MSEAVDGSGEPRVVLVGRQGCHLCDEARDVVRRVADETSTSWTEVDVDADPELLRRYSDQVPVVLVDGQQHDFWRVDEQRLRAALSPDVRGGRRRSG